MTGSTRCRFYHLLNVRINQKTNRTKVENTFYPLILNSLISEKKEGAKFCSGKKTKLRGKGGGFIKYEKVHKISITSIREASPATRSLPSFIEKKGWIE